MRLRGLQHVSVPFHEGEEPLLRHFYGEVLGLTELIPPRSVAHLGLVWFSAGPGLELHFFRGSPGPTSERHFCFDLDDLEETRQLLVSAGSDPYDDTPIPARPRFFCRDPVGNLIEFTRIDGDYLQSPGIDTAGTA
jgi:catechol 2,3-dioxygenase-like lactoylglutathione lyase family enzyme